MGPPAGCKLLNSVTGQSGAQQRLPSAIQFDSICKNTQCQYLFPGTKTSPGSRPPVTEQQRQQQQQQQLQHSNSGNCGSSSKNGCCYCSTYSRSFCDTGKGGWLQPTSTNVHPICTVEVCSKTSATLQYCQATLCKCQVSAHVIQVLHALSWI